MIKIDPGVSSQEILSEERFQGSIVQEAKPVKAKNVSLFFCGFIVLSVTVLYYILVLINMLSKFGSWKLRNWSYTCD